MQLIVENLVQLRGARTIIDNLSFAVSSGEALVLTGPNGAGKTTLLRTVAGFLKPAAGRLCLEGGDSEREIGEQSHFVGHLNGLKANLTVAENLRFWAEYLEPDGIGGVVARAGKALDRFGLGALATIPAGYLSAGQKRRLALSRLLVAERPIWLLDEPTASLDAASAQLLTATINEHIATGGIAVVATHLPLGLKGSRELRLGTSAEAA